MLHVGLHRFQSARASFLALLRAGKPKKVWMPKYICNAMLAPLQKSRIEYVLYELTDKLEVSSEVKLRADEWLLYVNYFGVCGKKVDALMQRFSPSQIVLDYSQSFFSEPHKQALASIYSPRKFFGVPDGGLLYSQISVPLPDSVDTKSFIRMEHLIRRLGISPESGYAAFQKAEESLNDMEPRMMSKLSERILTSIGFESVIKKRKENFQKLHNKLGSSSYLTAGMNATDVPLCYPYWSRDTYLRNRLISNGIFVATYWSDALGRLRKDQGDNLVKHMLPLPIDQRYGADDMERILKIILK